MRRFGRILLNAATAVSLVLCAGALALWVRGYWVGETLEYHRVVYRANVTAWQVISWKGGPPGTVFCSAGRHPGDSVAAASFNFGFPFPAERTKAGRSFVSLWTTSLNRSARRFCSMRSRFS